MLHNILIFSWFSCCSRRAPEPQKPQARVGDDVVRSNHYDPDDDEEYYRKQLSFFDRRSFDSKAMNPPIAGVNRFHEPPKPPQTQIAYPFARYPLTEMQHVFVCLRCWWIWHIYCFCFRTESVEKVSPVDKRYEPLPPVNPSPAPYGQNTPAAPPTSLPKLTNIEGNTRLGWVFYFFFSFCSVMFSFWFCFCAGFFCFHYFGLVVCLFFFVMFCFENSLFALALMNICISVLVFSFGEKIFLVLQTFISLHFV